MAAVATKPSNIPGPLAVSQRIKWISAVLTFLGVITFGIMLFKDKERAWHAYLTAYFYFTSLSLGGLFFAALQHMSKAGWSVNIRRITESLASFLPVAFVGGLILLIGAPYLYVWLDKALVSSDHLLSHKAGYLNFPFFIIRMVVFFGLWLFFAKKIVGFSLAQDKIKDDSLTLKSVPYSIAFIGLFALSYSFFSIDLVMSLEPHWFSTMFGVYTFSGLFQSSLAFLILVVVYCMKKGLLTGYVNENHLHDLGKFLFAFTIFWAYIAYSQYMLIWYANLPEETGFFMDRLGGSWLWVSVALIVFKFIVPFMALLPRWTKRSPAHLAAVSVLILIMQYVDNFWLIYPSFSTQSAVLSLPEILIWLGFGGIFLFCVARFLSKHPIVPIGDPRIHESIQHHVVY